MNLVLEGMLDTHGFLDLLGAGLQSVAFLFFRNCRFPDPHLLEIAGFGFGLKLRSDLGKISKS